MGVGLSSFLSIGLLFGLSIGLLYGLSFRPSVGLLYGLASWMTFGLLGGLLGGLSDFPRHEIETVDKWNWNSKKAFFGLPFGLISGLLFGLIGGLLVGLISGLFFGLWFGLISGLEPKQVELITRPGERLFLSAENFLFFLLLVGLIGGLIGSLFFGLDVGLRFGLSGGLLFGLLFGLSFGLFFGLSFSLIGELNFGGSTLFQHYSLRFVLSKNNLLPWKLIPFLDQCVDLIILRQVGGGYIFVHRLLMEHFAAMYTGDEK